MMKRARLYFRVILFVQALSSIIWIRLFFSISLVIHCVWGHNVYQLLAPLSAVWFFRFRDKRRRSLLYHEAILIWIDYKLESPSVPFRGCNGFLHLLVIIRVYDNDASSTPRDDRLTTNSLDFHFVSFAENTAMEISK